MANKIYECSIDEIHGIRTDSDNVFLVELDGKCIQTKNDLFSTLEKAFQLPDAETWAAISDWLRDLSWLNKNEYILIVTSISEILKDDERSKEIFLRTLSNVVEWWSGDVEKYVVDGKKKFFNVYLVD